MTILRKILKILESIPVMQGRETEASRIRRLYRDVENTFYRSCKRENEIIKIQLKQKNERRQNRRSLG